MSVLVGKRAEGVVRETRVVSRDELLGADGPAVTPEGHGYDPARGELWFAGETAEAVLLELDARRKALAAEAVRLAESAADAARVASARSGSSGQ